MWGMCTRAWCVLGAQGHRTFIGFRADGRWLLRPGPGPHVHKLGVASRAAAAAVAMATSRFLDHWGAFLIGRRRLARVTIQTDFTGLVLAVSRLPPGGQELLVSGLFQYPLHF